MKRDRTNLLLGLLVVVVSTTAAGYFLWRSQAYYGYGFPLDDAWIHQTYARNLATQAEWAFLPGEISAGSTSPLWTFLLSLGYALTFPPLGYTFALGVLILILLTGLITWRIRTHADVKGILLILMCAIFALEWHLVWAALSGMETLFLGLHIVLVLIGLERNWPPLILGCIAGLGIWIRPDALLSLLPIAWVILSQASSSRIKFTQSMRVLGGFILFSFPYLLMNLKLGGEWWPSTFYAKQVEYAVVRSETILSRVLKMGTAPLIGAGMLLVPGVVVRTWRDFQGRNWPRLAGLLWIAAFISAYALRLPVDYQHGRYMIPVIPALFLLGYDGILEGFQFDGRSVALRIISRAWMLSLTIVALVFWLRGARAYAVDVGVIESEMVTTAKWVEKNTEQDALIAAHDIGALGYFGERQILDLAGLITPDVIPIIRDEAALESYLNAAGASYLMTFPGWYPRLTSGRSVIYTTGASISPSIGGENMTIYRWP